MRGAAITIEQDNSNRTPFAQVYSELVGTFFGTSAMASISGGQERMRPCMLAGKQDEKAEPKFLSFQSVSKATGSRCQLLKVLVRASEPVALGPP